jgi:anti-sigma-K factor RskA
MSQPNDERLLDLLEKRVIEGLTDAEKHELDQLGDDDSLELTAAAVSLGELETMEPMPAHLRARIEERADEYFSSESARPQAVRQVAVESGRPTAFWNWFGWALAGALCIALIANIYLTRVNPPLQATQTPAQKREQLMATATDIDRANVGPGKEAYTPSGDIVWSDSKQEGYIHVKGLPKNDPTKEQYQLWIYDENQDPKTPVDGGVFDVSSDGEVIIPVNAKLTVRNPKVLAITVEKPGGVPVSKAGKIAALAKVET